MLATTFATGCHDDTDLVRKIQSERQAKRQTQSQQDHLGEVFALLRQYIELDSEKADRQLAYHLNRWSESRPDDGESSQNLPSWDAELVDPQVIDTRVNSGSFLNSDALHLRDSFLFHSVYSWVDVDLQDELLLEQWLKDKEADLDSESVEQLRTATRLFDWTIRNIAIQPMKMPLPVRNAPEFPQGLELGGSGYRQSNYQTLTRGAGDGLQRGGVFTQLCRQADIPAAFLATIDSKTGTLTPFCVGVLIEDQIYLFEPTLGIFVPGPDQTGIATLAEARSDAVILRRLGIAGLDQFTYPVTKQDVQQCVALLNLLPETVSPRMQKLQAGLTGNRRMNVFVDAEATAKAFDDVTGISGVRFWDVPLLAEIYSEVCNQFANRDPLFAMLFTGQWGMLEGEYEMAIQLARGRWQHLLGVFSDDEDENKTGARTLYLAQRTPEFEIDDLRIDVDLQRTYFRRELGMDARVYDQQLQKVQEFMRMGKRTASFWISMLQADDGRLETAEGWLQKRVLDENQPSIWIPSARYNLGRLAEMLGDPERAIELYKREGEPQEHGNRIRARLVAKQQAE